MLHIKRQEKDEGIVIVLPTKQMLRFYVTKARHTYSKLGFASFDGFGIYRGKCGIKFKKRRRKGLPLVGLSMMAVICLFL